MKHKQRKAGGDTFYGKYRARVTKTYDGSVCPKSGRGKENRGRIKVECPAVYGMSESPWCEPLWGYCLDKHGDFVMPELGDYVYIEFEEGNSNLPIWSGAWVQKNQTPLVNDVMYDRETGGCSWHGPPTPHVQAGTLMENSGGEDGAYQKHHDAVRVIQFGKFWIAMHRNPPHDGAISDDDWLRIYLEDPNSPEQKLFELFANEGKFWLKRKRGTMTLYSDDAETYLERGAGKFILFSNDNETYLRRDRIPGAPTPPSGSPTYHKTPYGGAQGGDGADFEMYANDSHAYFHRKDSELFMQDADTQLWKGDNKITMTPEDIIFDVPNDVIWNVGNDFKMNVGNDIVAGAGNSQARSAGVSINDSAPEVSHN